MRWRTLKFATVREVLDPAARSSDSEGGGNFAMEDPEPGRNFAMEDP